MPVMVQSKFGMTMYETTEETIARCDGCFLVVETDDAALVGTLSVDESCMTVTVFSGMRGRPVTVEFADVNDIRPVLLSEYAEGMLSESSESNPENYALAEPV